MLFNHYSQTLPESFRTTLQDLLNKYLGYNPVEHHRNISEDVSHYITIAKFKESITKYTAAHK